MRNFYRINNYFNKEEAWKDWIHISQQARAAGKTMLAKKYRPALSAGWRTIDKKIAKLRAALEADGVTVTRREGHQ